MLLEEFPRNVEGFPRSVEGFPRSEEGFPLEVFARPSDVSIGERSRRLLILGSTKDDVDGTTLPCVSIIGCPFKELSTSALSASPRRLTEGVLEAEGPTSVEAGVASCLLLDTETEFRRLRDDFWDWLVLELGMRRLGGIELPRKRYVGRSRRVGAIGAKASRAGGRQRKRYYARGGQFATILKRQNFLAIDEEDDEDNLFRHCK